MKVILIAVLALSSLFLSAEESKPFFQKKQSQPYHLSIGAVLFDREGHIACHHFKEIYGYKDVFFLMRESMENDETPLMTMHRGLKEEFEATGKPIAFLGGLTGFLHDSPLAFEKTTLYVVCQLLEWHPESRNLADTEGSSVIEWHEPHVLISLMEEQAIRYPNRIDVNEAEMVRRAIPYIPQ